MKKKKNAYVSNSKSIIRAVEPFVHHYLLWNILHKVWKILLTIEKGYESKISNF